MLNNHLSYFLAALVLGSTVVSAESFSTTEYIKVTRSVPSYATLNEEIPSEQCQDVREDVSSGTQHADVIGAVAGGALGGVLGSNVGGGRGKTAATVGGAVLGVLAGQNIGSKYNTPQGDSYRIVRKCQTVYTTKTRKVISGYSNIAKVKGQEIRIESDQPLKQIPVT
ncbi:MAG: glycine zipper 2TM domain-containing protein, partial [Methylococcales bacterium]|nr:glycine zipper 2TM domain-containing protein [Methylococcales bacterium]